MFLLLEREISSPSIFSILCLPPLTLPSLNPGSLFLCLFSRLKEACHEKVCFLPPHLAASEGLLLPGLTASSITHYLLPDDRTSINNWADTWVGAEEHGRGLSSKQPEQYPQWGYLSNQPSGGLWAGKGNWFMAGPRCSPLSDEGQWHKHTG